MRWLLLLPFTSHHGMKTAAQCLVSQQGMLTSLGKDPQQGSGQCDT